MNLKKCDQGHFYDQDKEPVCPQCKSAAQREVQNAPVPNLTKDAAYAASDVTQRLKPESAQENTQKVEPSENTMKVDVPNGDLRAQVDDVRTVGIITNKPKSKAPVAGWLVCVEGKHYGEDF